MAVADICLLVMLTTLVQAYLARLVLEWCRAHWRWIASGGAGVDVNTTTLNTSQNMFTPTQDALPTGTLHTGSGTRPSSGHGGRRLPTTCVPAYSFGHN